ncbi:MAG: type III pantothenate kinase [Betaproteobacteria bacterium]|nr:type III pantothenate kinase [Betaproteobacteria bacterium]
MSLAPDLLAIDAGNTRVKGGWFADGNLVRHEAWRTADVVRIFASDVPPRVIASNVAGPHIGAQIMEQCALNGAALHVIRSLPAQCGVVNGYREPAQLGTDRWAALIAARAASDGACLVVVAGTATTVDMLHPDGRFLGGVIVPGLALMRQSLSRGTAQLPDEEGAVTDFPASTPEAIANGALKATLGAIDRMRATLAQASGAPPRVLISGGAAPALLPHLDTTKAFEWREHLVLEGLRRIAREAFG